MGASLGIPNSAEGLAKTQDALDHARKLHAGQSRKDEGGPFILHPREVASLLYAAGAPDHVIAAGALHDLIEKTPAVAFDLRARFGSRVAALVELERVLRDSRELAPAASDDEQGIVGSDARPRRS